MSITQLDDTTFHVAADTCRCSNPQCDAEQKPLAWMGNPCRKCGFGMMERDCYEVDVGEYGGTGFCSCLDFKMKHQPKLESGRTGPAYRCKHIRRVLESFRTCL